MRVMKFILPVILLLTTTAAFGQTANFQFDFEANGVRIEPDKRLFTVLASLEAAGLEVPLSPKGEALRLRMREDFKTLDQSLLTKMRTFIRLYKTRYPRKSDSEVIAPFISMAFVLSPAPEFTDPARTAELPADLLEVLDYSPLLKEFHRSSITLADGRSVTVGRRLDEYFKEFEAEGDSMRLSAAVMIVGVLDYLHTKPRLTILEENRIETVNPRRPKEKIIRTEIRERERRFFIVPDLLAQNRTVNFRNARDDYYVIVPPGTDIDASEARRAYFQFVLDPIILQHSREIIPVRDGLRRLLEEQRRKNRDISPDIFLAVSRSLVGAADASQIAYRRQLQATEEARRNLGRAPISETTDSDGRKVVQLTEDLFLIDGRFTMPKVEDEKLLRLAEDYENGAILSFYFAKQLKGLEESGFDIATSLRDMLQSINVEAEEQRLSENAEAIARAKVNRERLAVQLITAIDNPVTRRLLEIEDEIKGERFPKAESELTSLLEANPSEIRVLYALGRVKSLSAASNETPEERNDLLREAKNFFDEVLKNARPGTDDALMSLTYVALARIYEYFDQDEYAVKIYEAAIRIGDVPGGAYREAESARTRLLKELGER
jgi:tetratricopeptide (TPR) repeat protein